MKKPLLDSKSSFSDIKIATTSLYVLVKTVLLGILIAEIWYLATAISQRFLLLYSAASYGWLPSRLNTFSFFLLLFLLAFYLFYLYARGFFIDAWRILKSKRVDILFALSLGVWIDVAWGGFFSKQYKEFVLLLNIQQLLTIISIPFIVGILVIGRVMLQRSKNIKSTFIPDHELTDSKDDLLNFGNKASAFAENVFNGGSSESFVFGVDAPWGIGKSTFINFCQEYWREHYGNKIVVYKFSPLRFFGSANLLEVFIDGLIHTIQKDSFIPEIRPIISRYSRLLKEVSHLSIFGFNIPSLTTDYTVDDALKDLTEALQRFDKKVIIVIDDLDRIDFTEIKNVLFVIRKSFVLPNISYVLCYDTENIGVLDAETPDIEKVSEFLEKFVNVKISLYLDKKDLTNYISENLEKIIVDKPVDPMLVRQAIGGLLDIYKSTDYHKYLPFIGDARKLKRLINTVVMFKLHGTDFKNSDFDKQDLIHLLLIYIHYPKIFRKIYDTETNGGYGFFSAVTPLDNSYPKDKKKNHSYTSDSTYENSEQYYEYVKPLREKQRFLLDQVFNVNQRLKAIDTSSSLDVQNRSIRIEDVPEELKTSLACFNGDKFTGTGRNLESYLQLIVNLSKPEDVSQHKFYTSWRDKIADGFMSIDDVFKQEHFSPQKGEQIRTKLWRIVVNSARKLNAGVSVELIKHLLANISKYSLLEIEEIGIGLRHSINYFLIRLLNDAGWTDQSGRHTHNTEENIKEISEWIFGEGRHAEHGVLEKLSQPMKGILGLHDLMLFRLQCSADRGGDIFDLTRALSKHGDKDAPTEGDTRVIAKEEMREISQKVFQIFKAQYINKKVNIFSEVENLQLKDLAGVYKEYVEDLIHKGLISEERIRKDIEVTKNRIISFIVYQLGNDLISSGVGCGFYDPTGKEDKHQIKEEVNDYLFNFCFKPENGNKNYEYFLDYLLRNYTHVFMVEREDRMGYVPRIEEFIKVLDKSKLADFWKKHGTTIKKLKLEDKEKTIFVGSYSASYKEDLPKLYKLLDKYIDDLARETATNEVSEGSS